MDWRGIEWAVPVFEMVMLVVPVYAFVTLYRRVKRGVLEKSGALWRYASLVIAPIIFYVLFFFAMIGIAELVPVHGITEELARSFLILVGLGGVVWFFSTLIFGIALVFLKKSNA